MKKVNAKNVTTALKSFAGFEAGRRLSNGVAGVIPVGNPTLVKAGIATAAIVAAAVYNGKGKEMIVPALVGMASEQGGQLLDEQLAKVVPATAPQIVKDVAGLNGGLGCGCGSYDPDVYPSLNAPVTAGLIPMEYNESEKTWVSAGA